jgi:hypothetical protein
MGADDQFLQPWIIVGEVIPHKVQAEGEYIIDLEGFQLLESHEHQALPAVIFDKQMSELPQIPQRGSREGGGISHSIFNFSNFFH